MSAVKTHFLRLKQLLSDFPVHRMMCVWGWGGGWRQCSSLGLTPKVSASAGLGRGP